MPSRRQPGASFRGAGEEAGGVEQVAWIGAPDEATGHPNAVAWVLRLDDPHVERWLSRSPPSASDLGTFASFPNAGARIVRRRLARLLLGIVSGTSPGAVTLDRTPGGGVHVAGPAGWHVSLAGRSPWCAIAVARSAIGIDVEAVEGEPLPSDLLTPAEVASVAALPPAERLRASLACWVAKEAHAKRLGRPRTLDPAAVETCVAGEPGLVRSGGDRSRVEAAGGEGWIAAVALHPRSS